jgi:hypothetical protein
LFQDFVRWVDYTCLGFLHDEGTSLKLSWNRDTLDREGAFWVWSNELVSESAVELWFIYFDSAIAPYVDVSRGRFVHCVPSM